MKACHVSLVAVALSLAPLVVTGCVANGPEADEEESTGTAEQPLTKTISGTTRAPIADPSLDPGLLPPSEPGVAVLASGDGWQRLRISGSLEDPSSGAMRDANDEVIVLMKDDAIDASPLSARTKTRLHADSNLPKATAKTAAAKAAPVDEDLVTVVSVAAAAQVDEAEDSGVAYFGCSSYDDSYSRSISVNRSFTFHKGDESGAFTGEIDFDAAVSGSASATVRYRVEKSWCVPYKVSFKKLEVVGNASLTANASVDGRFQKAWSYQKTIAKPELASFKFWAGPVPVYFKIRLPVEAAVEAKAQAELHAQAKVIGNGSFNLACSSSSCTGTKSATMTFARDTPPSASVNAKVDVTPSVSAALRGVLYSEDIAYGDVGVRGSLPASLWGYYGNGCGDADNDGVPEWVSGLTLDLRAKVDIFARVDVIALDKREWSWNLVDRHVGFWSFGEGTALDPIFYGERVTGTTARLRGRMRPCWPYGDRMTYRITWGDGAVETVAASPSTLFTKEHTFGSYGSKTLKLEAVMDHAGRDPEGATTRNLVLRFRPFEPIDPPIRIANFTNR